MLSRCRKYEITLDVDKLVVAASAVSFWGYILLENGIAANPLKILAIADFATPANLMTFGPLLAK